MQAQFLPSRTVSLYLAKLFLVRTVAIIAALVLVLQALDLLSESGNILAHPGNGDAEIWRYISLRSPQIMARFLPFSVLLATIFTLATLNSNSEVTAMKASGLSAHQVLAPLIIASLGVAVLSFVFNDRVVSRATATLNQWRKVDYAAIPIDHGDRVRVWVRDGDDLVEVGQVQGRGNAALLTDVTVFDRDGGKLLSVLHAPHARRDGAGWRTDKATRFDVASGKLSDIGSVIVARGVRPDQFTLSNVDPAGLSFFALRTAIGDLADAGRPTKALEGSMWHKISEPLSSILMPLLGAVAGFGLARSGKLFVRAVIGMMLGFAYFVADNFALSMGNLGAYPPFLAAWAPFLLFMLIGEVVLIRTEE